jgi:multiple sugar transport system ATP-binding protein
MADVLLDNVSRVHTDGTVAVADLSLHVHHAELLAILGPSGCGKSTVLRMVAGIEPVTSGTIYIGGDDVTKMPPHLRDVAMVFEGNALYPHLTARANMRFGLDIRRLPETEIDQRVGAESRVLGLGRLLDRLPKTLSAGQRQRVAVGRATVRVPRVFLLDEPLTHLDASERIRLRSELAQLQRGLGVTAIYVTHDQYQAMAVGDRVAVLRAGRLEQLAKPRTLYQEPASVFVAGFVGDPAMSLLTGRLVGDGDGAWIVLGHQRLRFHGTPSGPLRGSRDRPVVVGIRAEHVALVRPDGTPAAPGRRLRSTVGRVERLGYRALVHCPVDVPGADADAGPVPGYVVATVPPEQAPAAGTPVELEVDTGKLSFFDPASGGALWHGG